MPEQLELAKELSQGSRRGKAGLMIYDLQHALETKERSVARKKVQEVMAQPEMQDFDWSVLGKKVSIAAQTSRTHALMGAALGSRGSRGLRLG